MSLSLYPQFGQNFSHPSRGAPQRGHLLNLARGSRYSSAPLLLKRGNPISGRKKATKKIGMPIFIKIIESRIEPIRVIMPIKMEVENLIVPHAIKIPPFMIEVTIGYLSARFFLIALSEPSRLL